MKGKREEKPVPFIQNLSGASAPPWSRIRYRLFTNGTGFFISLSLTLQIFLHFKVLHFKVRPDLNTNATTVHYFLVVSMFERLPHPLLANSTEAL